MQRHYMQARHYGCNSEGAVDDYLVGVIREWRTGCREGWVYRRSDIDQMEMYSVSIVYFSVF